MSGREMRVLIVAENASARFGGEAALPLHYYRVLRQRGVPVWLVTHARTRAELAALYPEDGERMVFVPDSNLHRWLWRLGKLLPDRIALYTTGWLMRLATQIAQRRICRDLVRRHRITVVHQPMPVSPKEPSLLFGLGAPVIVGPMNGGITFPPAFRAMENAAVRAFVSLGRATADLMNLLLPGKRRAALLLVANERTRAALPRTACRQVELVVENGVDLALWRSPGDPAVAGQVGARAIVEHTRFAFVGRLVEWKAVDLLLEAFRTAAGTAPLSLTVIGDGTERRNLEQHATALGVLGGPAAQAGKVSFAGWLSQAECADRLQEADVLVLPSLMECGGAVVLEAMAMGKPVIATAWGGPVDYLDDSCGILVAPDTRESFVTGLAQAMIRLAQSPETRLAMGRAGRARIEREFDWERKVDVMLGLYERVSAGDAPGTLDARSVAPVAGADRP